MTTKEPIFSSAANFDAAAPTVKATKKAKPLPESTPAVAFAVEKPKPGNTITPTPKYDQDLELATKTGLPVIVSNQGGVYVVLGEHKTSTGKLSIRVRNVNPKKIDIRIRFGDFDTVFTEKEARAIHDGFTEVSKMFSGNGLDSLTRHKSLNATLEFKGSPLTAESAFETLMGEDYVGILYKALMDLYFGVDMIPALAFDKALVPMLSRAIVQAFPVPKKAPVLLSGYIGSIPLSRLTSKP
jgi:hypothetical protein